ncbi:MAG: MFS transporter [Segetibacter sp.]
MAISGTGRTFYFYAGICLFGFLFIWRKIKEAKGKSLEEMDNMFIH